jgi:lipid II:glycine glycyltransferase (peptidoglycan interpeptide bridge formation enzyme)
MENEQLNNLIFKEIKDELFNPSLVLKNYPFTQAEFYGEWQKSSLRVVRRFVVLSDKEVIAFMQAIEYPLMFGKKFVYIPYGPIIKNYSQSLISFIKNNLKNIYSKDIVFVRFDFSPTLNKEEYVLIKKLLFLVPEFAQNSAMFQPRLEWVLSLGKTEEEILMGMHKNTRYSIRVAEKNNVETEIIKENLNKYFEDFYSLMKETSLRNGFNLHTKKYYQIVFDSIENNKNGFLVLAKIKGKIVVAELFVFCSDTVTYLFAGSSDDGRSMCPTYKAQWEAIKYSKSLGLNYYNFGGIAKDEDKKSGWHGLTSFKKKFGGVEISHSVFFDLILNPVWYFIYFVRNLIRG